VVFVKKLIRRCGELTRKRRVIWRLEVGFCLGGGVKLYGGG
jgi:hypothetical protein